jgi:hypothetical protein
MEKIGADRARVAARHCLKWNAPNRKRRAREGGAKSGQFAKTTAIICGVVLGAALLIGFAVYGAVRFFGV